jgi:hypothetical protein
LSKPFRSDKRKKELLRLKKQEEKRQRRFGLKQENGEAVGENVVEGEGGVLESDETAADGDQPETAISKDSPSEA